MNQYVQHIVALGVLLFVAPASISVEPVDISLQTLVILTIGGLFKPRASLLLITAYIILGAFGLPVFSGYEGGYEKLIGPTAGFFVGFLITPPLISDLIPKVRASFSYYSFIFILAHLLILMPGFVWLGIQLPNVDLMEVLIPLLPGLFIKSLLAGGLVVALRKRLT